MAIKSSELIHHDEHDVPALARRTLLVDESGSSINPDNPLSTLPETSFIDTNNSSTDQLGNGGIFTGTGTDVTGFSSVAITVHSDEDSASDGMTFQFSQDNTNWDDVYEFNLVVSQDDTRRFQFPVTAQYFRVVYTNGTTITTEFRVQTILHRSNIRTSTHRIDDVLIGDRSTTLMKSTIIGESSAMGGTFVNVKVSPSGSVEANVSQDTAADLNAQVVGNVAHDAVDSGNPIKIGGKAHTTAPASVDDGDRVNAYFDALGNLGIHDGGNSITVDQSTATNLKSEVYGSQGVSLQQQALSNDLIVTLSGEQLTVVGNVAHGSADAGNPVKVGSKAIDYDPDSEGEQGPSEVDANDRANITANLRGEIITAVKPQYNTPTNINTTYNDVTTTATSASIECWQYRQATFSLELDRASTPIDIQFFIEVQLDNTNWTVLTNDWLGAWIYDDQAVGSGLEESATFPIAANNIRIRVVATGTTETKTFTVANARLYLRT